MILRTPTARPGVPIPRAGSSLVKQIHGLKNDSVLTKMRCSGSLAAVNVRIIRPLPIIYYPNYIYEYQCCLVLFYIYI
jgi:hypothetical protein